MMERCGDRQRKFDGLGKWPFRLFIESLPIMLQVALLLLASGLSRYMWSVNTSVARIVISFTVFGIMFYIGIVAAGTSSYECPFQTPASIALRHLRDSGIPRKFFISFIHAVRENTQRQVGFRIPSLLPHRAKPVILEDLPISHPVWHSHCFCEGRTPNHHPTSPGRSSFREHKVQAVPRNSKV